MKCLTTYFAVQFRDAFLQPVLVGFFAFDFCLQRPNFFREFGIRFLQLFDLLTHATVHAAADLLSNLFCC